MDGFTRYAIFYAPPPGPLADFGAAWLGWEPRGGRKVAHPDLPGLPLPTAEITKTPHKYGLHATLKPPFRLKPGFDVAELHNATLALASALEPVLLDGLRLDRLGSFLALVPEGDTTPLALLAARVVEALDGFRAAPGEAELEQRRKAGLTRNQEVLLQKWGYPYVMEEFRFHLTLTGTLPDAEGDAVAARLRPVLDPILPSPVWIRDICLFGEGQDGRFHNLHRYTLSG
jgi:putative phosphonate metabolism protein